MMAFSCTVYWIVWLFCPILFLLTPPDNFINVVYMLIILLISTVPIIIIQLLRKYISPSHEEI